MYIWRYEEKVSGKVVVKEGVVVLVWKYEEKSFRKGGLRRGVVFGDGCICLYGLMKRKVSEFEKRSGHW